MDITIKKIEEFFKVPERFGDKIKNVAEKVKGGYALVETRPQMDDSFGLWTRLPVAKIIFHQPSQKWKLFWMRASGKWEQYAEFKTLEGCLVTIRKDKHGCFWG